jgi:hypothetical protein
MKIDVDLCGYGFNWRLWHYEFNTSSRVLFAVSFWWNRKMVWGRMLRSDSGSWKDHLVYSEISHNTMTNYTMRGPLDVHETQIQYFG